MSEDFFGQIALAVGAAGWRPVGDVARMPRAEFYDPHEPRHVQLKAVLDFDRYPEGRLTLVDGPIEVDLVRFHRVPSPKLARAMLNHVRK